MKREKIDVRRIKGVAFDLRIYFTIIYVQYNIIYKTFNFPRRLKANVLHPLRNGV